MNIEQIKFDEKGLVPAIIQDYYTKEVLTLAYMNKESLEITLRDKKTCFYSRSRQELWLKGETSGNYQNVVSVKYDCDSDSLLVEVKKEGPACHTGSESCFFNSLFEAENNSNFSPEKLYNLIKDRKVNPEEKSYTSYLFEKGLDKILKKVGEECTEVIIGAKNNDNDELKYEIAEELGVLSENEKGWRKELNLVSWNEREPKYDIRDWNPNHDRMSKGITLTKEEAEALYEILKEEFGD